MTVRVTGPTLWPNVYGEGGPVLRASFHTGAVEDQYLIDAVMPCAPGDFESLLLEDNAQRAAGVVLPGDEGIAPQPRLGQPTSTPTAPPPTG
ncbi:hypothetical protein A6122_0435 [Rathayibacter tritici]|uniref:Uncharacterized protein n=2 Tax=Rathayibacter tritici TaxID=33888 RepID=A0A169BTJ4_9MICO|nr:hypothetical protein A6122_0435 [Rathayibacter tritici]